MRIDSHLHLWNLADGYDWMGDEHARIRRDLAPEDARELLLAAGFSHAVLVQAADHERDTARLVEFASSSPWILGVVGWAPLGRPDQTARWLDTRPGEIVGVRTLLHADPDPSLLSRPEVRDSLAAIARAGLPIDVPDAYPHLLPEATSAAAQVDGLGVVLDHLGKPPSDRDERADWRSALAEFAKIPSTVAKVSGLHHGGTPLTDEAHRASLDAAIELFGAERLMLGSDYPMWELAGDKSFGTNTARGLARLESWLEELSDDERASIEHGTATRVYGTGTTTCS